MYGLKDQNFIYILTGDTYQNFIYFLTGESNDIFLKKPHNV